jgi:uncharacterized OB-fold protein
MTAGRPAYPLSEQGALIGSRCQVCGKISYPPHLMHCNKDMHEIELSPYGVIETWSMVHVASKKFEVPYRVSYVRLDNGLRITAHLGDGFEGIENPSGQRSRIIGTAMSGGTADYLTVIPAVGES